jgi:hypothetical protein
VSTDAGAGRCREKRRFILPIRRPNKKLSRGFEMRNFCPTKRCA